MKKHYVVLELEFTGDEFIVKMLLSENGKFYFNDAAGSDGMMVVFNDLNTARAAATKDNQCVVEWKAHK